MKPEMIDIDYLAPLDQARREMGPDQVLCGNLNPFACVQDGSTDDVYNALKLCHSQAGNNFIVGAGCELTRHTPHDNMRVLTEYAKTH